MAKADWLYQLKGSAEHLGVSKTDLRSMVVALVEQREKQVREEKTEVRRREKHAAQEAKQRLNDQKHAERERQREQDHADREAQRKHQEKEKAFKKLSKLPHSEWEARLAELAKHLGDDPAVLAEEFAAFTGVMSLSDPPTTRPSTWNVVPWDEPIDVAQLLQEVEDQIGKYVVFGDITFGMHYRTAATLWVAMSWVHNEIATHSAFLDVVSLDEGSGKSELLGAISFLAQRPCKGAEFTGPNIYRTVDRDQPTMIFDEMDDAFERNTALKHIMNHSWTRGAKIPRQVRINGELQTHWFNIFCPKVIGHLLLPGKPLPRTITSRGICLKLWPKRSDEHVEEFKHCDNSEFTTLRRKLLRFANDHTKAIAEITPSFPAGFNNRLRANWKLLLAIAELAGGDWPKRARKAAEAIAGKIEGSRGARLFTALHALCVTKLKAGATELMIPSEEMVAFLKEFDPYWATDYRASDGHAGEITKAKLAALLRGYEIYPQPIHPTKRAEMTRSGYVIFKKGEWNARWLDMFARYASRCLDVRKMVRQKRK